MLFLGIYQALAHRPFPTFYLATPRWLAPEGVVYFLEPQLMHTLSVMSVFSHLSVFHSVLTLAVGLMLGASAAQAAPTELLNDTGQTQCADASDALVGCDSATTGDSGVGPRQDGRFGRDVATPAKIGGGDAGFDFSKVCFNGAVEGTVTGPATCTGTLVANTSDTASDTPATDWACTKDNVTNLVWSLQSQAASWDAAAVSTYPEAGHNSISRCGFDSGWRLPTVRELLGIVHNGKPTLLKIDTSYFPDTQVNAYWTSETYVLDPSHAWFVNFNGGSSRAQYKTDTSFVRLVRSGQ